MKTKTLFVGGTIPLLLAGAGAQAPTKPAPSSHTGCVMATPDDPKSFLLAEKDSCSLLSGKPATKRLAGHVIVLHGSVVDATATEPQTIVIEGVDSISEACEQTCTLEPPGHRGLRKKPKAGTPGGTPGY